MFNFFKKNKTPTQTPVENPETLAESPISESPATLPEFNPEPIPAVTAEPETPVEPKKSWTERLRQGLAKTRSQLGSQLASLFNGGKIDEDVYEELETILLTSDVGVAATQALLEQIRSRVKRQSLSDTSQLREALKQALLELLTPLEKPLETSAGQPFVIMLAGVNGAGKTTTIGKLANLFQAQGKSVLIAAGDTFRAARVSNCRFGVSVTMCM